MDAIQEDLLIIATSKRYIDVETPLRHQYNLYRSVVQDIRYVLVFALSEKTQ